ncbi:tyrosyl-DNA phosphodiesterase family protein [Metarhizium robertsii]|uniref:Tyrosyl-DNA phosphodiesterase family protein n=1 Tax=Metarhizium robertsii TaxID=568076 RepID=A0A0A1UWV5_9HYPO|nr:tyrosyl-DNA phosphodiesterase family protein [Metarhizium robertsii]
MCQAVLGQSPTTVMERHQKRQRVHDLEQNDAPTSLSAPISPPRKSQRRESERLASPWQLTWIRDLPEELNYDAVTLKDLLGDPLISDCWEFNYLHDVPFLMDAFDQDTRHLVNVHVVHGFWKRDDPHRLALTAESSGFDNVKLHVAPMPEMFGTHHSKMMVLFRHDNTAEIIIHTANMIPKDWTNMTNAVWRTPRLSQLPPGFRQLQEYCDLPIGSGERFKADLLNYLKSYDSRKLTCRTLIDRLVQYDFSSVKGALIASVPGKHDIHDLSGTAYGWSGVKRYLSSVPCKEGAKDTWLQKTLFDSLATSKTKSLQRPKFSIVFPTADEIRQSLDGYASGASIHTKIQSSQQAQQLGYLRRILHHWANDSPDGIASSPEIKTRNGGRDRAAPHIKTYIRYNEEGSIDWAMLTSANISKQAWGEASRPSGELRVASWEIGVLVWPGLVGQDVSMVGTFQSDVPKKPKEQASSKADASGVLMGVRIPYSLPLQRYGAEEVPWVATMQHSEPDRFGRQWME